MFKVRGAEAEKQAGDETDGTEPGGLQTNGEEGEGCAVVCMNKQNGAGEYIRAS